jgi:hypothetical protein
MSEDDNGFLSGMVRVAFFGMLTTLVVTASAIGSAGRFLFSIGQLLGRVVWAISAAAAEAVRGVCTASISGDYDAAIVHIVRATVRLTPSSYGMTFANEILANYEGEWRKDQEGRRYFVNIVSSMPATIYGAWRYRVLRSSIPTSALSRRDLFALDPKNLFGEIEIANSLRVEEDDQWKVSSFQSGPGGVAVRLLPSGRIALRANSNPRKIVHVFSIKEWDRFIEGLRDGA